MNNRHITIKEQKTWRGLLSLPAFLLATLAVVFGLYGFQAPAAKAGSVMTIGSEGTQIASLQPGTGVYLGGGFTLSPSGGNMTLSSVGITVSGTVSTANLSNMKLMYEINGTCGNNITGMTQYAATSATVSAKTTFTSNLTINVGTQMCVYVVVDIGSGVSDGQTLDISIAANSDITVTSGGATITGAPQNITGTGTVAGVLTVGQSGTVTASISAPTTGQYVGAGFTLSRTNGGANLTSIKITKSGTVADTALSNLKLYYKTESPCTYGGATGATLFNSAAGTFTSGTSTVTGSFAPGSSQICLYVVLDIDATAANGSTLGFGIANPSTDVVTSSGTVTPASAVNLSGSATISVSTGITVSGTLYDVNGSTALLAADAMKLAVSGTTAYTTTASATDGTFSFTGVTAPATGGIITVWLNGNTDKASLVFRYSGTSCNGSGTANCTALKLIKNRVILDSFDGSSITNTDLSACDNDTGTACTSTDIGFTSNSNNFIATFATNILNINSGATYVPGGTITAQKINVQGTLSTTSNLTLSGAGTITTCGDPNQMPLCVGGTFSTVPASTTFSGQGSVAIPARTYGNLFLGPSSGSGTYTLGTGVGQTITVNSGLSLGGGATLSVDASTYNPSLVLKGTSNTVGSTVTYTHGSGLTVFQGSTTQSFSDNTATKQDMGAVQISAGTGSTTLSLSTAAKFTSLTVDTSQSFTSNGAHTLTLTGTGTGASRPLVDNGTFTASTGTVEFIGTSLTEIPTVPTYNNLTLDPAGAPAYTLGTGASQTLIVGGTLTIGGGSSSVSVTAGTYNLAMNLGSLVIGSSATFTKGSGTMTFNSGGTSTLTDNTVAKQDLGAVVVAANGTVTTLNLGNGAKMTSLTINGAQTFSANGNNSLVLLGSGTPLANSGTFTASTGTVEFTGGSATTIPATTYYNLILDPAATATYTLSTGTLNASDLTIGNGTNAVTVDASVNSPAINLTGNLTINANAAFTHGASALTFKKGSTGQTITDNTTAKQDLGPVVISSNTTNTTVNMATSLKATSVNILASQTLSANGSNTLTLTGSGTGASRPFTKGGTFTASTGTVEFTGTGATTVDLNGAYNNLIIDPGAVVTYTLGTASSQTLTVSGNLTIGDGTNAVTVTAATNSPALALGGNLTINANAVYTKGSGTTTANKAGTQTFTDSTASKQNLGALAVNGSSTVLNMGSDLKADSLSISASQTFNAGSYTLTLYNTGSGVVVNNGTFNSGTGTVDYASSGTSGTIFPALSYYNLTFDSVGNTFSNSTGSLTVANDLTINNGTLDLTSNNNRTTVGHNLTINGTFLAPSDTLTVNNDFVNNGTFTPGSANVVMSPSGSTSQVRGTADTSFYNFRDVSYNKTIEFAAGRTYTISGTATMYGQSGTFLNIESTTPGTQWILNLTGNSNIYYVTAKDSGCTVGSHMIATGLGSKDYGNNGSCWAVLNLSYGGGATAADNGSGGGTPTTGGTQYGGGTTTTGSGGGTPTTGGTQYGGGTTATP